MEMETDGMREPVTRKKTDKIYIHCSASPFGEVEQIRRWHTDPKPQGRGWEDIGYHFVVCNGYPFFPNYKDGKRLAAWDGKVQKGRLETEIGAHCAGDNATSIAICLIGAKPEDFTLAQINAAVDLAARLCKKYGIVSTEVYGHREFWTTRLEPPKKDCPIVDMMGFRKQVSEARAALG